MKQNILYLSLALIIAMLIAGCDFNLDSIRDLKSNFLKKNKPAEVVVVAPKPEPKPVVQQTLCEGMSEEEVNELLGKPTGTIYLGDQVTLLYNGIMLDFVSEKLVLPRPAVVERANQRIKVRQGEGASKAIAAPAAE